MSDSPEMLGLSKIERYGSANELLEHILTKTTPSKKLLREHYSLEADIMGDHYQRYNSDTSFKPGTLRRPDSRVPTEISDKRSEINADKDFQLVQFNLTHSLKPNKNLMFKFFGEYTDNVYNSYCMFIEQNKLRKCGISSTTHHNRTAGMMYALLDKSDPNFFKYVASMALHDIIEDLLYSTKDESGKPYGLAGYDRFVERFIHPDLHVLVKRLTNHYDLILQYVDSVLEEQDKRFTRENLVSALENEDVLKQEEYKKGVLNENIWSKSLDRYVNNLLLRLDGQSRDPSFKDFDPAVSFFDNMKWASYHGLYIPELVIDCAAPPIPNFVPIEQKGAGDISDNFNGRSDLNIDSRIKIAVKQGVLASTVYALHTDWGPLNNHVQEMMQNSLRFVRYLVLRDLLEPQSPQDYFESAIKKVKKVQSVLYIDKAA